MSKLPYMKAPCANCPFRKDSLKGWLGAERMEEILDAQSFTCHKTGGGDKTDEDLRQCAGHMHLKAEENDFVLLAQIQRRDLALEGRDLLFDDEEDCIIHHDWSNL